MATNSRDIPNLWTALAAGLILGMMLCSLAMLDALPTNPCPAALEAAP